MNLHQLDTEIKNMEQSHELLTQHHQYMTRAFESSHFSSIASRFKNYKVLIQSMEVLNSQSKTSREMVVEKSENITCLETDLK